MLPAAVIDAVCSGVPAALIEVRKLGRTLKQRAADVLALLRTARDLERPDRSDQRPPRTPPRLAPWASAT